nr:NAD-glutamate dehydrogenase domain-containing protein [Pseudofrankia asymbiotica]
MATERAGASGREAGTGNGEAALVAGPPGGPAAVSAPEVTFSDGVGGTTRCALTWPVATGRPPLAAVVDVFTRLGVEVVDHDRPPAGAFGSRAPERDEYLLRLPEAPDPASAGPAPTGPASAGVAPVGAPAAREVFGQLFVAVWTGQAELDEFTRLALTAGVPWREVDVIRAAWRFLHQTGVSLSHGYAARTVLANPAFAHGLLDFFRARFDPDYAGPDHAGPDHAGPDHAGPNRAGPNHSDPDCPGADHRAAGAAAASARLEALLAAVASLDQDRILRGLRDVLAAVIRTNHYQRDAAGRPKPALALKIASSRLGLLPAPRPWVEVFVTSPTVEGVHMRGGRVARGGLRFSDRPEDYRTEVHGLYRAQVTKNVVIVPDGAKGAFVLHEPTLPAMNFPSTRPGVPADLPPGPGQDRPDATRSGRAWQIGGEVGAAYRTFVSALLDVTDNLVGGKPVGPERTVCYDEPDTYLVVAADKGTATFSDLANEIAAEYGYWLGDAFASGGSAGYDHKAMGITARGAWESARQHLRELGVDADRDPFTAVGIGDMSGDVFGNGVLRSRSMRLVAAFDHRHIFIDPDPDPAASFAERQRLYDLPSSSWADYDPKVLSPGGGVFRRDARRVELSARAREILGLPPAPAPTGADGASGAEGGGPPVAVAVGDGGGGVDSDSGGGGMSPVELIQALLRAPVDLLYNGGIGTYVKASTEDHGDAADHANDAVRVDADELRARVVVEGGNLGLTQAGRVELAHLGGKINTDFLDNSAGVDTSDREVNLKILLAGAVDDGELTLAGRDELLRSLTDDVAASVLDDSAQQAVAVSLAATYAPVFLDRHIRLLRNLEARSGLVRSLEHLPSESRLEELRTARTGLTRPELALLQAKAKTLVRQELLDSPLPDAKALDLIAQRYFPPAVRERFADRISEHPLVREIIATRLANELVNRMGPGFVFRLEEQVGVTTADAARAYAAAAALFGLDGLWAALDRRGDAMPAADELAGRRAAREFHELAAEWLLRHARGPAGTTTVTGRLRGPATDLAASFGVGAGAGASGRGGVGGGTAVDADLTARIAGLGALGTALDLLVTAPRPAPAAIEDAAAVHEVLGGWLGLAGLHARLADAAADSHWTLAAKAALRARLTELWATLDWLVLAAARADAPTSPGIAEPTSTGWDAEAYLAGGARALTARWLVRRADAVGPFTAVLAELAGEPPSGEPRPRAARRSGFRPTDVRVGTGPVDVAAATVAIRELRLLVERVQFTDDGLGPRLRDG